MLTFTDDALAKIIKDNLGVDVSGRAFLPFTDVDQSVRDDVALLAAEPLLIKGTPIIGCVPRAVLLPFTQQPFDTV